jgi:hypothetical protein
MTTPRPGGGRCAPALAAGAVLLVSLALAPAVASADYASANEWAGGGLAPDRQPGNPKLPVRGTLVSMTTSPTRARLSVNLGDQGCRTENVALKGRVTPAPGGDAEHLTISVEASRRVRNDGQRLTYAVSLRPAAPGILTGTASVRGTYSDGRRRRRCDIASTVVLRSRSSLDAPRGPSPTDPGRPRAGVVASLVAPRVKGAIAITRRADGWYHGMFTGHNTCRSGRKRSSFDSIYYKSRFRIRADGTFRSRVAYKDRGTVKKGRFSYSFVGTLSGRIDPDGIARGIVSSTSHYKETGYLVKTCRLTPSSFAAAPAS